MSDASNLRAALAKIAELASGAVDGTNGNGGGGGGASPSDGGGPSRGRLACTPKFLPRGLLLSAAKTAANINPVNSPMLRPAHGVAADVVSDPLRIAVLTSKYWGPAPRTLTVSFLDRAATDLRARILSHMNAWTRTAGIRFAETHGVGDVRIAFAPDGYWSYLGTDIRHIARDRPTMNLQDFSMRTPESEYKRVVRHETGHTLGFPHEHMRRELVARIDPEKAYAYFLEFDGWDRQTVDEQVLTPLDDRSIMGTPADQTSIMCYQLPGSITKDGEPILGGFDVNATDFAFAGKIYPKSRRTTGHAAAATSSAGGEATAADADDEGAAAADESQFVREPALA